MVGDTQGVTLRMKERNAGSLIWSISLSAFPPSFFYFQTIFPGFPGGTSNKETTYQCRRHKRRGFDPWVRKIPWKRAWQSTAVFLPRESHGQRSVVATVHGVAKSLTAHTHIIFSPLIFWKGSPNRDPRRMETNLF